MKNYEVIATVAGFNSGQVLRLTAKQAAPRLHNLRQLNGDHYEVVNRVEFKRGEVVGVAGDVSKALLHLLQDTEAPKPATAQKKAKAEKPAKASPTQHKTDADKTEGPQGKTEASGEPGSLAAGDAGQPKLEV